MRGHAPGPGSAPASIHAPVEVTPLAAAGGVALDVDTVPARPAPSSRNSLRAVLAGLTCMNITNLAMAAGCIAVLTLTRDERPGGETAGLIAAYALLGCISSFDAHLAVGEAIYPRASGDMPGTGVTGLLMDYAATAAGASPYGAGMTGRMEALVNPLLALGVFLGAMSTGSGTFWFHFAHVVGQVLAALPRACMAIAEAADHDADERMRAEHAAGPRQAWAVRDGEVEGDVEDFELNEQQAARDGAASSNPDLPD